MTIDVSQFVQAFLDESFEGLDLMESELLGDDILGATPNSERINTIFRAAHSIKGSAATFGFAAIGEFTHGVETLLDQIRAGDRALTNESRNLLLDAVDRLREMLSAARDHEAHDQDRVEDTRDAIARVLATAPGSASEVAGGGASPGVAQVGGNATTAINGPSVSTDTAGSSPTGVRQWQIHFRPSPGLLATGNDPLRIFAYLRELGELEVECENDALPTLTDMQPEDCYLGWRLTLTGAVTEEQIREAFEWVEDHCDLAVTAVGETPAADVLVAQATDAAPAPEPGRKLIEKPSDKPETREPRRSGPHDRRNDSGSIRVAVDKVDDLVNLVGELVISQAMLTTIGDVDAEEFDEARVERLRAGLAQLERNTRELQEAVLSVRMVPINFVFSRFPRLVRDLASTLGKKIDLVIDGEETELDRGLIEKLTDPLMHIVRNALDHGIETPETRVANGKPATGTLRLKAAHQGGNVVIEISDDGAGLNRERILRKAMEQGLQVSDNPTDREVWQLIFAAGFSTADQITDISGRGVGMDVVRQNIESINGRLDIESASGQGTRITIRLPLTLAILDGMSVRVGEEIFILPLTAILESLQPQSDQLHSISGRGQVVKLRGDYLPLVSLGEIFNLPRRHEKPEEGIIVVVESAKDRTALAVDELIAQHQVVIKSLETNYRRVPGISGATIMGDGRVAMILDVDALTSIH